MGNQYMYEMDLKEFLQQKADSFHKIHVVLTQKDQEIAFCTSFWASSERRLPAGDEPKLI